MRINIEPRERESPDEELIDTDLLETSNQSRIDRLYQEYLDRAGQ